MNLVLDIHKDENIWVVSLSALSEGTIDMPTIEEEQAWEKETNFLDTLGSEIVNSEEKGNTLTLYMRHSDYRKVGSDVLRLVEFVCPESKEYSDALRRFVEIKMIAKETGYYERPVTCCNVRCRKWREPLPR